VNRGVGPRLRRSASSLRAGLPPRLTMYFPRGGWQRERVAAVSDRAYFSTPVAEE